MKYIDEIQKGMDLLASNNAVFVGQAMRFKGTALTNQVKNYHESQLIEMPVAEEFQMGFCLGLALTGKLPISVYPRSNFAILAANQLVNHIDKWEKMGAGKVKVIIKIAVGSQYPLDPGQQHQANYAQAFRDMCETVKVYDLIYPNKVLNAYQDALNRDGSTILIEHADLYRMEQ